MLLQILSTLLVVPALLVAIYHLLLMLVVPFSARARCPADLASSRHTFAIVIPAHNEEQTILATLESCKAMDYPKDKYSVYVLADNCTDNTKQIVCSLGITCLERTNKNLRGKGHALGWGFERILKHGHDAVVVMDADCQIEPHALRVFDYYLDNGDQVLQANDVASNPDESAMSYALAVGNIIENDLFYAPKSQLGMAVILRGTGMVFSADILRRFPWNAESMVEDMEYALRLLTGDIKVRFVLEAKVSSKFPADQKQMDIQRTRWAGTLSYSKSDALNFMWRGLTQWQPVLLDIGWNMLVLSRPLILLELLVALLFACLTQLFIPSTFSLWLMYAALLALAIQAAYFGLGIFKLGITAHRLLFLLKTPFVVLRLLVISLRSLLGSNKGLWTRTPRDTDEIL